jgi:hypothetical protein
MTLHTEDRSGSLRSESTPLTFMTPLSCPPTIKTLALPMDTPSLEILDNFAGLGDQTQRTKPELASARRWQMRFRKLTASKFRPKHPAARKEGKACAFFPPALKAAKKHIDTERLPDSTGSIVAPTPADARSNVSPVGFLLGRRRALGQNANE